MMGILPSMDCIGILAAGLHNLIEKNPTFAKSQRTSEEFKKELNWTLFQNSGFKGVQSDVLQLSHYGDLDKPFMIGSILDVRQPSMNWYARTDDHRTRLIPMAEGATALFYNNGTNPPLDQTPHIVNQIAKESERGKIIWIFYGTGLGLVGVSILVLLVYRTRQEVRAASFSFTTASILGYAAAYGSNYFYFGVPTAQTCVARIWLLASAFCLIVGSIGLKNARLCMIYKSRTIIPKWKLSDGLWLGFLFGVFSLEQVVLFSWALFSKIHVSQVFMGSNVDYSCEVTYSLMSYILWASNSLLFFYLCTITHTTRNMSHKHSEFGLLLLICISVPLGIFVMLQIGALFQTAVIIWTMVTTILVSQVTPILIQLYASSRSRHWMHQWRNRSLSFNTIKPPLKTDKIPPPQLPESQFVAKWGKNSPMLRQVATIKKCRNLTDSSVSTTSKRKSSLVFDGDFPETSIIKEFPVIICVKQGFGMQSEWLAGSVAINKIGMAVCILFWYRNKDPSEPTSDASMMAFRPKISNNVVDSLRKVDGGWMLSLDTHQGILVLEFEEGEVFEDFKNHLVYSAAI
ncbi:hypothetical protein BDR26DRAFT_853154 [Obelidium mucronatum]|nr:hypothetical protein BDR26DRAFT_853154 [Obelidium mucronatum]